jgi:hypothetical protein
MRPLHDRSGLAAAAALLLGACAGDTDTGQTERPGAQPPADCDRTCLEEFTDRYLEALVAGDPSSLPLKEDVLFVENNQVLEIGQGTWRTVTGLGSYRHFFADVAAGQAGLIATVEEQGEPILYDLRLAIADRRISEIEALAIRSSEGARLHEGHGAPDSKFMEIVPEDERLPRQRLVDIADLYLSGMEGNDPDGDYSFFHDECNRWEHGRLTTNQDPEAYGHSTDTVFVTLGCREQFETGFLGFVTRIRDRRYVLVDEERQTVFGFAFLDHDGTVRSIPLATGGVFEVPPYFSTPRTLQVGEAWRIEDGRIRQIEMTLTELPYGMRPAFETADEWLAGGARPHADGPPLPSSCDRACLRGAADAFLAAAAARDPDALPLAPDLKYTENGQQLNPGDGLWGTLTERGEHAVYVAGPGAGTVVFYGDIVETDVPGLLVARVAVSGGRITEIEALVVREEFADERGGTLTLFAPRLQHAFDPRRFLELDPTLGREIEGIERTSRDGLRAIAGTYYAGWRSKDGSSVAAAAECRRRVNGVPASLVPAAEAEAPDAERPEFRPDSLGCAEQLGSGYFGFVQRIRDRRTWIADEETGVAVDLALLDVPNDRPTVEVDGVGDVILPRVSSGPYSMLAAQLYKVIDGSIVAIEAAVLPVPYGMAAGWQ